MGFKRPDNRAFGKSRNKLNNIFEYTNSATKIEFPVEVFPPDIQKVIVGLNDKVNYESPMTAAGILYTIAVIAGGRVIFKVNSSWEDNSNIWIVIVGKTGSMKTPVMKFAKKPIDILEDKLSQEYDERISSFNNDVAAWDGTKREQRGPKPVKPGEVHYITMDATVEGLIYAFKKNLYGVSIYKDELSGFFGDMNRYTRGGSDEAFYLSAFGNDSYYKIRKTDSATKVKKVTVSIFGGIQPRVLNEIAVKGTDNGMIYRFLYVESDNIIRDFSTDNDIDWEKTTYLSFIESIVDFVGKDGFTLEWDTENTRNTFIGYLNELNEVMRKDDTSEHMRAYIRKLQTYLGRFTALMCIMHKTCTINEQMLQRAAKLIEYFMLTGISTFDGLENEKNIEAIFKRHNAVSKKSKIIALLTELPNMINADIANATKSDKGHVSKVRKEFEKMKVDKSTP